MEVIIYIKKGAGMMEQWLTGLKTDTAQDGYDLAVKLARKGVGLTQPDEEVRKRLRLKYAEDADSLTFASQVIAIHFQTVAAANDYWK